MKDALYDKLNQIKDRICPMQIERMEWLLEQEDIPYMILIQIDSILSLIIEKIENFEKLPKCDCDNCEERDNMKLCRDLDRQLDVVALSDKHMFN